MFVTFVYNKCREEWEEKEQKRTPQRNGAHDLFLDFIQRTVVDAICINPSRKAPEKDPSPSNGT